MCVCSFSVYIITFALALSVDPYYFQVCEQHFKDSDFENEVSAYDQKEGKFISAPLNVRRLKKTAVPSVFPGYPTSSHSTPTISRHSPNKKRQIRENSFLNKTVIKSIHSAETYFSERNISNFQDIFGCIEKFGIPPFWSVARNDDFVCLVFIEIDPEPFIKYSIKIDKELQAAVFIKNVVLEEIGSKFKFPQKITNFTEICEIISQLKNLTPQDPKDENTQMLLEVVINLLSQLLLNKSDNLKKFIIEQLQLSICKKTNVRYSTDLLVFASLLSTISSHAYNFLRQSGNCILPHPNTLKKVCNNAEFNPHSEIGGNNFLMYAQHKIHFLKEHEKTVTLMLDEIHLKPYYDYKGGSVVGAAINNKTAATSAFVFMVSSVLSTFKDVVHILPAKTINNELLHSVVKSVILGLEKIGYKVICIITDNNAINRKAISKFSLQNTNSFVYPHPANPKRPLFFLIDSVHLLKNIRNNWINQKNQGCCMFYPDFDSNETTVKVASFLALKKLHEIDNNSILVHAYGLTFKSLSPSNLERQNVKLVLKIFNKFVVSGLIEVGSHHNIEHYKDTSHFISIICKWWDIMNVKTPYKGLHKGNVFMKPLTVHENDEKYIFLNKFVDWLERWDANNSSTGRFTKETVSALKQTSYGMIEICRYCTQELNMSYILPGKMQTDPLEERFGKYRQVAGAQYHISIRQLLECEKKLRLQSSLKLELLIKSEMVPLQILDCPYFPDERALQNNCTPTYNRSIQNIFVDESDTVKAADLLPVITYLAGYCCHMFTKKNKMLYM